MQYDEFIAQNRSIQHDKSCQIIGLNFPVRYFPRHGLRTLGSRYQALRYLLRMKNTKKFVYVQIFL